MEEEVLRNFGGAAMNDLKHIIQFDESPDEMITFMQSPYYDLETLKTRLKPIKNRFSILSLNIQSLNAKFNNLVAFVSLLDDIGFRFSAICLQETWLSSSDDYKMFDIPGYSLISQGKQCTEHGGLAIYLLNSFTYSVRNFASNSTYWEGQILDIFHQNIANKITICNIYRPPKENNRNACIEIYLNEILPLITKIEKENSQSFFLGDYNIDLLKVTERQKYQDHLDQFTGNSYFPAITLPTRFSRHSCTLIDQIFYKLNADYSTNMSGIILSCISDHLPNFIILDCLRRKTCVPKYKYKTDMSQIQIDKFVETVRTDISNANFNHDMFQDPSANYDTLINVITKSKEQHLPTRKVKCNKYKDKLSPWITNGIMRSISFRDKLYKRKLQLNPNTPEYLTAETNLKTYNNILQKNIRQSKKDYYYSRFQKFKNDSRKIWGEINTLISKKKNKKQSPKYFLINNEEITESKEISESFNNYFATIGTIENNNISTTSNNYRQFMKNRVTFDFKFKTTATEQIEKIIKALKPKTSFGHDNISSILTKHLCSTISGILTVAINQSLCTGIFPDSLKISKITPIYKKGDSHIISNYRPISLLPTLSKIFEKVVFNNVYDYLIENNLLFDGQYGFRKLHSTEFAALEFTDRIFKDIDDKKIPFAIFLDLSRAFDTIDHDIMLFKLEHYGIRGKALDWFSSYLKNRQQYVIYDDTCSTLTPVKTGVPQGSILGPLLFILYINDLHKVSSSFDFILYADDSTLKSTLCVFNDNLNNTIITDKINKELDKIQKWLTANKLSLNVDKTKMMVFHNKQKKIEDHIPQISINGKLIERVTDFNFLGIIINEHLDWSSHISKISNKICRTNGILNKLKRFLPTHILRQIYCSLILPHFNYGILLWGFKCSKLSKLQKKSY